ncbi:NACHT domain-containing protein [Paludibacter sp.]|uniref:NACHT domain-containing protein n=1 Tax=Paludibacter sp. TaxID=1898105 RepID=UPI00135476CE|nr:NACHT domain-containing protein [Paludibacter sp.]MTK53824.1 NACHT domain-containing protein [Paludibacter sp.]
MNEFLESIKAIDYADIIEKKIVPKVVEKGIVSVNKLFKLASKKIIEKARKELPKEDYEYFSDNYDLEIEESFVLRRIADNLKKTNNWAKEIYFNTALTSKRLNKVFVEIDLFLSPLKFRFDESEKTERVKGTTIIKRYDKHKIIYGGAGAGKTTFIKKICTEFLENPDKNPFSCPVVIRFRDIDYSNNNYGNHFGLFPILIDILGIQIKFPIDKIDLFYNEYHSVIKQAVVSFLDDCNILLIADGFDEIPNTSLKNKIEKEFHELSLSLESARFILTSRNNDFILKLPQTEEYEICPLNDNQIKKIIKNWLGDKKQSEDLYEQIRKSPYYDTTMRPLTLSHLCAIYERRKTIPPKPRYIYDFVLNLLLESWDQQRSIVRPSEYADFYIEKKKEFLAHLSYWFSYHLEKNVFSSEDLKKCYNKIYKTHNLPPSQSKKVVIELENHTGLLVQIGYNSYEFSHKSLQEFLTAKYIYSLPKIPEYSILKELPNETAIAICLSSSPNAYFENFIKDYKRYDENFWNIFLDRLVDESPDFNENPSVLVFFFITIKETEIPIFRRTLKALLEHTNLKISISNFNKIYTERIAYKTETRYTHKNISISVADRNNFPGTLIIGNDIVELINK